jgi:hypothetical protein
MRYQIPPDHVVVDLLTDAEYDNAPTERARILRGRAKAWELHRANGPSGQLKTLSQGAVGDSILLKGYTRSGQVSSLTAAVSAEEGCQFRCSLERSLVDGSVIGVRVTLVAFTR